MEWTRSDTIALAMQKCARCHGLGLRTSAKRGNVPCNCVLRAIFRACYARFRYCVEKEKYMSQASLERIGGKENRLCWGRKDEEYIADFCLVSRRILNEMEHKVFKYHFLLGADWRLCTRKLGMDRGNFFHMVYRIEQKLGKAFRELEPYALYPLDEYFHGPRRPAEEIRAVKAAPAPQRVGSQLRPPLRRIA